MSGTGRLTATLGARTQRLVYGEQDVPALVRELEETGTVDLAHLVMLVRQDLLPRKTAAGLLRHITWLRAEGFAPLHRLPAPRGAYLMYETHLIDTLGVESGGKLHTGRSRNDLKATTTAIRLRATALDLVGELVRLQAVLLSRARASADQVMPVHTHFQAAMPTTYGHYLLGVACALDRDIAAVRHAADGLRRCPLGAGAVGGTDLPIDPAVTAELLGFDAPVLHSIDAVASRDVALRLTAAAAGAALTLSRLGTDYQLWSSAEFGMLTFPDRLVGGSSAMPQKRNAFLLEHVRAKAGSAVGAWTAAAGMTKSTPFTNTIEVGTEAMSAVWPGLDATRDCVLLCQLLVSGARLVTRRAQDRAEEGFTLATTLANRLVRAGVPFRVAHHAVGDAVRAAVERGDTELRGIEEAVGVSPGGVELGPAVEELTAGGGAGAFAPAFGTARRALAEHAVWRARWEGRIAAARHELDAAVREIIDDGGDR
ncbi:argininosuccinate lyase [Streptomyces sp. CAI 127]|uniref:argininosuccinate lyase n=1 Tax=Streptomyces sp. CAI 127 TaxID=1076397 RepID=UPI0015870803|nr:argininosuccinate lyase [Streptomyces sp. CAI 127]NUW00498.1 argininosuccinate lyase [Streptomyces sp. CAI 127]